MLQQLKIHVACQPVNFRKGIDDLASYCRQVLAKDPYSGALFLFRNKQRTALKVWVYHVQGMWLCTKRLSHGQLTWWRRIHFDGPPKHDTCLSLGIVPYVHG